MEDEDTISRRKMKKMMKNEQENEACEGKEEGDEEEMEREKRGEKGWIDHLMTRREIRLVMKRGRHIPLSTITVSTDYGRMISDRSCDLTACLKYF